MKRAWMFAAVMPLVASCSVDLGEHLGREAHASLTPGVVIVSRSRHG